MTTTIIAHRGARALVDHENTLEAFDKAVEVGADMVEFDVRRCVDGALVLHHDPELPDGRPLAELTLEEVLADTRSRGFNAPTLAEAVEALADRIRLDVEVKEPGYEAEVLEVLLDRTSLDRFVVKSFHDAFVRRTKMLEPRVTAGLLLGVEAPANPVRERLSELFPVKRARACRADFVSPNHQLLKAAYLRRAHRAGLPVWVWTVNERGMMRRFISAGVDAIITDHPDLALEVRGEVGVTQGTSGAR